MQTPYYLIEEARMLPALERIRRVTEHSGTKVLLALKCFSAWCAFPFMRNYLAGTTSSSLYEAKLGREEFGGETHGYSVAFKEEEARQLARFCDKVIFNSVGQMVRLSPHLDGVPVGLRVNPGIGYSQFTSSNPVSRYSRLGVRVEDLPSNVGEHISGLMTHINCDNSNLEVLTRQLRFIEDRLAPLLGKVQWFSLGGGIAFTDDGYPLEEFCDLLSAFSAKHRLQLYLEPGEAAASNSTSLLVTVLDIVHNEVPTLIVDAGVETHLLDVLTYGFTPELEGAVALSRDSASLQDEPGYVYRVCGRSCLAGDLFGNYRFERPIQLAERLCFTNVGAYSMVKKNFFNGLEMPAIYHRTLDGKVERRSITSYQDFRAALS